MRGGPLLLIAVAGAGCTDALPAPWQLDRDRVVAVRATPPRIRTGDVARLEALIAHAGAPVDVEQPALATAAFAAADLFTAVHFDLDHWQVDGPTESQLAAARAELGLPADAPVPLEVSLELPRSGGHQLLAQKVIWLGDVGDNPVPGAVTVGGAPAGSALELGRGPVALAVEVDPGWSASWSSSCGTLHDATEPAATLDVEHDGELVLVVRDGAGGVAWQLWPVHAP